VFQHLKHRLVTALSVAYKHMKLRYRVSLNDIYRNDAIAQNTVVTYILCVTATEQVST